MHKLFLHIGTHKTGTTSIQRFCAKQRDALLERGVFYPSTSIGPFPDHYAHHRVAHAIAGRDPSQGLSGARGFFDAVESAMDARAKTGGVDEVCLISAEPMYRHVLTEQDGEDVTDAAYERYARAVRELLGNFDTTVLVMLRRQDLFAESLYAEHVLSTGYTRPIERFIEDRGALLDYEARIGAWARAFGAEAIAVELYEPENFTTSIEQLFLERIGVTWDDGLNVGPRKNISLPRALVEFKRMMNTHNQRQAVNSSFREWIDMLNDDLNEDDLPDLGRFYLQPRDRVELLDRYSSGNRVVAERYLGRRELFSRDPSAELAAYVDRPKLSERQFREIARRLFQLLAAV